MNTTADRTDIGGRRQADALARAPRRVEGREKVTGALRYAGDLARTAADATTDVAVAVIAAQASGRILAIETGQALSMPGVRLVMSHVNAPKLHKVLSVTGSEIGDLLPMQGDRIDYGGECVALVVADTLDHAREAAARVEVRYSDPAPAAFRLAAAADRIANAKKVGGGDPGQVKIGDPEKAWSEAPARVDLTLHSSPHHHNAMEPGAIVAAWDADGGLTVQLPTQFSYGDAMVLGQAFGFGLKDRLPRIVAQVLGGVQFDNKVRVISTMSGGAFGSKNGNGYLLLAPMVAKLTGRSVKLVLTRRDVFTMMPFRAESRQRLRLGADASGKLLAVLQDSVTAQGAGGSYIEPVGETIPKLYAAPNILVHQQSARLDTGAPGWMRAPGACLGTFAIETAMDVLAADLGIDPLDLRLRNHADVEPDTGHEWSSKSLKACYEAAGRRIGWFDRDPVVGSMREGRLLVGYGMASSVYKVMQMPAVARIILGGDGVARVQSAMHEIAGMVTAHDQRARQIRRKRFGATVRADRRTAAALGTAEGLVQHEHAGIETQLAGADPAHHAVEIGVVVKTQAARFMHDSNPFLDVRVVDAHVVGIVDHQRSRAIRYHRPQRFDRRITVLLQRQRDELETGCCGGRRIARMGLDGRDDLVARFELSARRVIGARDACMRVGRVRAAGRLEYEAVHAREFAQREIERMDDLKRPLQRVRMLARM